MRRHAELHFVPHHRQKQDVQQRRDRQGHPQVAMVTRCFAPAHLMQHGAGGSVERMQAAVLVRRRRKPAVVFDLIGAFDKPSSVKSAATACGRGGDGVLGEPPTIPHRPFVQPPVPCRAHTVLTVVAKLSSQCNLTIAGNGRTLRERPSAASRHDRPCVPHAKDDHDGPPKRAASCGVAGTIRASVLGGSHRVL
jgi:hypothetical protein